MNKFQSSSVHDKRSSRRQFLSGLGGGVGALALANLFAHNGQLLGSETSDSQGSALPTHFPAKAKSCIFISLCGGASQIDMYDPKPKLREMQGETIPESLLGDERFAFLDKRTATLLPSPRKFSQHGESGMEISDLMPHVASCADDICMIRSMHTDAFNHTPAELVLHAGTPRFGRPSIGAWMSYGLGTESDNLPSYAVLAAGEYTNAGNANWSRGFLDSNHEGVFFRNQGAPIPNITPPRDFTPALQKQVRESIAKLNAFHFADQRSPEINGVQKTYDLAFRMQRSIPELVNLSGETAAMQDLYGMVRPIPTERTGWLGSERSFYNFSRNCLMARRMVERGVRFVHLLHGQWDHHHHLNRSLELNCLVVDQPIAALLKDLKQRGLLETTLVVCATEFGRTPLGENRNKTPVVSGRDHHPRAFSLWLAGAGVKPGHVVGATDEIGWDIVDTPVHMHDLHATILHLFGLDHEQLTYRFGGRDMRLTNVAGNVVDDILA